MFKDADGDAIERGVPKRTSAQRPSPRVSGSTPPSGEGFQGSWLNTMTCTPPAIPTSGE